MKGINPAALSALVKGNLDNFKVASTPGGIETQESEGQKEFVNNETLPKEGLDKTICENWGIKILKQADDLFMDVELPKGWKKKATDHSMWSELLNEKGRKVASIFYKAAFYDERAFIRWE